MSLIENLKEKNQIPQQTQMKAEFYTVHPETWITLINHPDASMRGISLPYSNNVI